MLELASNAQEGNPPRTGSSGCAVPMLCTAGRVTGHQSEHAGLCASWYAQTCGTAAAGLMPKPVRELHTDEMAKQPPWTAKAQRPAG